MRLMLVGSTAALSVCLLGAVTAGQTRPAPTLNAPTQKTPTQKTWTPPRTAWGDPDLEGIWPSTDMVGVPFERPTELAGRSEISDKEFAERQAQAQQRAAAD